MSDLVPEPDFQTIFDSLPGIYLVLKPDFTMVAANEARLLKVSDRCKKWGQAYILHFGYPQDFEALYYLEQSSFPCPFSPK